jgi:phosphatidylinositol glycan class T
VCTENLTPWLKLLPCKSYSGLASLLNAYRLYNSQYHSMSVELKDEVLTQKIIVVFDLNSFSRRTSLDWSLQNLFDKKNHAFAPCPNVNKDHGGFVINLETWNSSEIATPDKLKTSPNGKVKRAEYYSFLDVYSRNNDHSLKVSKSLLLVNRYLTGIGEEFGGIAVDFINANPQNVSVIYYDVFPWYMRVYMHSITFQNGDIKSFYYQPAVDRSRPSVVEMQLIIPSASVSKLRLEYDKTLLRYTEYPPDGILLIPKNSK